MVHRIRFIFAPFFFWRTPLFIATGIEIARWQRDIAQTGLSRYSQKHFGKMYRTCFDDYLTNVLIIFYILNACFEYGMIGNSSIKGCTQLNHIRIKRLNTGIKIVGIMVNIKRLEAFKIGINIDAAKAIDYFPL